MHFKTHLSFLIEERSQLNQIKREISRLVVENGFTDNDKGKIDIIVSELASNIVKHTTNGGEILVKPLTDLQDACIGIEILSIDNGPGMRNQIQMIEDGYSTSGTKGEGLGAIKRLSHKFQIYTQEGQGTIILSRFYKKESVFKKGEKNMKVRLSTIMVPKPGETKCGDGGCFIYEGEYAYILAVDGLGHGPEAEMAAHASINVYMANLHKSPEEILMHIHDEIKRTRGAVGAAVTISINQQSLDYAGVGNISAKICHQEGNKTLISYNGTLGYVTPQVMNVHSFPCKPQSLVIMHSDGLKNRWDISKYTDVLKYDPSVIAALVYKDNVRRTDDALVVVAKLTD